MANKKAKTKVSAQDRHDAATDNRGTVEYYDKGTAGDRAKKGKTFKGAATDTQDTQAESKVAATSSDEKTDSDSKGKSDKKDDKKS